MLYLSRVFVFIFKMKFLAFFYHEITIKIKLGK